MEVIFQGAEARLFKVTAFGQPAVLKERFQKRYRHPELEARLTKSRLAQEARASVRALKAGVLTPTIFQVIDNKILMEYIDGVALRERFDDSSQGGGSLETICEKLGVIIAKLHNAGIAHGDLTTSNVMERTVDGELVMLDFGLSKSNANVEDKAVDMYVLERAFSSTHPGSEGLFETVLKAYEKALQDKDRDKVIAKFRQVQQRGRKREMIG